jgi:uncharacterized protein YndB with AHSA1/START domain
LVAFNREEIIMKHFQHSILIEASPATVYAALTTVRGLRGWWSEECDIEGDTIHMHFGSTHKDLRIEAQQPEREVRWRCSAVQGMPGHACASDEWLDTQPAFHLQDEGQGTRVRFEHAGLVPSMACYDMCHEGWHHFLESLRQYAVTGRGTPYQPATAMEE